MVVIGKGRRAVRWCFLGDRQTPTLVSAHAGRVRQRCRCSPEGVRRTRLSLVKLLHSGCRSPWVASSCRPGVQARARAHSANKAVPRRGSIARIMSSYGDACACNLHAIVSIIYLLRSSTHLACAQLQRRRQVDSMMRGVLCTGQQGLHIPTMQPLGQPLPRSHNGLQISWGASSASLSGVMGGEVMEAPVSSAPGSCLMLVLPFPNNAQLWACRSTMRAITSQPAHPAVLWIRMTLVFACADQGLPQKLFPDVGPTRYLSTSASLALLTRLFKSLPHPPTLPKPPATKLTWIPRRTMRTTWKMEEMMPPASSTLAREGDTPMCHRAWATSDVLISR